MLRLQVGEGVDDRRRVLPEQIPCMSSHYTKDNAPLRLQLMRPYHSRSHRHSLLRTRSTKMTLCHRSP